MELDQVVRATIEQLSNLARTDANERYGMTKERQSSAWPEVRDAPRRSQDATGEWPREVEYSAESLGQETSETRMLAALARATTALNEPSASGLPRGLMAGLLAGCDRTHGTLRLSRQGTSQMEERESLPWGSDPVALSIPLSFLGVTFGSMVVHVAKGEDPPTAALASGYLAWEAADDHPVAARRKGSAPRPETS